MDDLVQMTGPDAHGDPHDHQFEDNTSDEGDRENLVDATLSKIWAQFFLDLVQTALNPKARSEPFYMMLTPEERCDFTEDLFKTVDLPFRTMQWEAAHPEQWNLIFNRFFPPKGHIATSKQQNYPNMNYFKEWHLLISRVSEEDSRRIIRAISQKFNKLEWVPYLYTGCR
ncbi:uncharacterized protein LAESUDRAFT_802673 [Laetiporus sulphureus 93-53]|uniref:Uncharacterized protein n=1 Tax=Laetiporus sulphureus 93-53 TaxID=1314785 RepID=A0A165B7X9_9APHY|nr:uncharacterized protein LAESUDRAFT_802673 [Laetiporus sulphureus 93-53]KZT00449.1 hypothetical protein LAESUDRAFT_802673 [Laetiporus sulphureus 93-53]